MSKPGLDPGLLNSTVVVFFFFFFFFFFMFIFEREHASTGRAEGQGDRGPEAGSMLTAESPMWGSTHEPVRL